MNLINLYVVYLKLINCLITKEVILKANKKILTDRNLECSIINPFFGHLFSNKMLPNLRRYYYNIIPAYNDEFIRDYVNDKETDKLSYALINLFPSIKDDNTISTDGTLNSLKKNFLDSRMRQDSIIKFGILFANILNFEEEYQDYRLLIVEDTKGIELEMKILNSRLEEFVKITKLSIKDEELLSLILLTIHSFMLDVLNNEEEILLYITTILAYIKQESVLKIDKIIFEKIEEVLALENSDLHSSRKLFRSLEIDFNTYVSLISDDNFLNSPIEYIGIGYIFDMSGKKFKYKKTHLDFLYNSTLINTVEQKIEFLFKIYEDIIEDKIDVIITKITNLIISSELLTDKTAKISFLPFYPVCKYLVDHKLSDDDKVNSWLYVLNKYEYLQQENYLVRFWSKLVGKNMTYHDLPIKLMQLSNKVLLQACKVLAYTNIKQIKIQTKNEEIYDWSTIFNILNKCTYLETLDIDSNDFSFEDRLKYYKFVELKIDKMITLNFSNIQIDIEDIKIISNILKNKDNKIKYLTLSKKNLQIDSIKILVDSIKDRNCRVNYLCLDFINIGSKGLKYLSNAIMHKNNKITSLSLQKIDIKTEDIKYFSNALTHENNKITELFLNNNNIKNTDTKLICDALMNHKNKINKISLSQNNISDEGAFFISEMLRNENNKLITLDLSLNNINDSGVYDMFDALKNNYCILKNINLSFSNCQRSIPFILEVLTSSECKLKSLNLADCGFNEKDSKKITDELKEKNKFIRVIV